jgi:transmembrane sensor
MTTNSDCVGEACAIAEQAAAWRVILGASDTRRVPEFWQWVTRSPEHVHEALLMGLLNQALQDLDPDGDIPIDVPPCAERDGVVGRKAMPDPLADTERKRTLSRWMSAAAAVAACCTIVLLSVLFIRSPKLPSEIYTTDVGEQRSITLIDGSTVVLDAQSRLQVQLTPHERSFHLLEGQALFAVASDPSRPFRVHTSTATIEAMGTEFNVRTQSATTVAVLGGVVRLYSHVGVEPSGYHDDHGSSTDPTQLAAGEGVSINESGQITDRTKVDRATVTAWEQRRLVFSHALLEDIAREFNRYNRKGHLRVEGNAASLRFGGVFDATDPAPLLYVLGKNPSIVLEHHGDDLVIRDRR